MADAPIEIVEKALDSLEKARIEKEIMRKKNSAISQEEILRRFLRDVPNVVFENDFSTCIAHINGVKFTSDFYACYVYVTYKRLFSFLGFRWVMKWHYRFAQYDSHEMIQQILTRHLKAL